MIVRDVKESCAGNKVIFVEWCLTALWILCVSPPSSPPLHSLVTPLILPFLSLFLSPFYYFRFPFLPIYSPFVSSIFRYDMAALDTDFYLIITAPSSLLLPTILNFLHDSLFFLCTPPFKHCHQSHLFSIYLTFLTLITWPHTLSYMWWRFQAWSEVRVPTRYHSMPPLEYTLVHPAHR